MHVVNIIHVYPLSLSSLISLCHSPFLMKPFFPVTPRSFSCLSVCARCVPTCVYMHVWYLHAAEFNQGCWTSMGRRIFPRAQATFQWFSSLKTATSSPVPTVSCRFFAQIGHSFCPVLHDVPRALVGTGDMDDSWKPEHSAITFFWHFEHLWVSINIWWCG